MLEKNLIFVEGEVEGRGKGKRKEGKEKKKKGAKVNWVRRRRELIVD